jgi:hypothetical protein
LKTENGSELKMVDISGMYTGGFLKAENLRSLKMINKWVTISDAHIQSLPETKNGKQVEVNKVVLGFKELEFELPLNITNGRTMKKDFGDETDNWIGQKIKFRVHQYETGEGVVIKSRQELEDEGDEIPPKSSSSKTRQSDEQAVDEILNQGKEPETLDLSGKQAEKDPEAYGWLNKITNDIIGEQREPTESGLKTEIFKLAEIEAKDPDLGTLDMEMAKRIFTLIDGKKRGNDGKPEKNR